GLFGCGDKGPARGTEKGDQGYHPEGGPEGILKISFLASFLVFFFDKFPLIFSFNLNPRNRESEAMQFAANRLQIFIRGDGEYISGVFNANRNSPHRIHSLTFMPDWIG